MNDIILLIVTYYILAILLIILVLNLIQYASKKKYKGELDNLDVEKNEIIDAPIMTELSKVESLTKTKSIKEKYILWKKEIDDIKEKMTIDVNDMILEADLFLEQKDFKDYLSKKTNIEIKNRFITFDISELPQSIQTTGYLVVLDHIMNRLHRNKALGKHTWIFIDEFHILLANKFSSEYIAKIYKTGRKENAIPTIITQNIADVIKNEDGCKILSNSEFAMILKQKPLDLPPICKIFDISDEEARYVTDSPSRTRNYCLW